MEEYLNDEINDEDKKWARARCGGWKRVEVLRYAEGADKKKKRSGWHAENCKEFERKIGI